MTEAELDRLSALQLEILTRAADLDAPHAAPPTDYPRMRVRRLSTGTGVSLTGTEYVLSDADLERLVRMLGDRPTGSGGCGACGRPLGPDEVWSVHPDGTARCSKACFGRVVTC